MTDEELRDVVLKNRSYFEKAIKRPLWKDVALDYKNHWKIAWNGIADPDFWIEAIGMIVLIPLAVVLFLVSPIWFPAKNWITRSKVSKILNATKP